MAEQFFSPRFYESSREPAWRRIGKVIQGQKSVTQAFEEAGLDYKVSMHPLYVDYDGKPTLIDRAAIMREPVIGDPLPRYFATVSNTFEPVQNMDIAKQLDILTTVKKSDGTPYAKVDTVGDLDNGKMVFAALDAGEFLVKGVDPVKHYIIARNRNDGGTSLLLAASPNRLWCGNQLPSAIRNASVKVYMRHSRGVNERFEISIANVRQLFDSMANMEALFNNLASYRITDNDFRRYVNAVYPIPPEPKLKSEQELAIGEDPQQVFSKESREFERIVQQQTMARMKTELLYEKFNSDFHGVIAETPYAALQAGIEAVDYASDETDYLVSSLFGGAADLKVSIFNEARGLIAPVRAR